jgi:hypothetical protein
LISGTAFDVHRDERLPPLSWLFNLRRDGARLSCGSVVENTSDAFFEGTWAAPFPEFGFHESANVFGSGGRLTSAGWVLVPPAHTLEAIYALKTTNGDWLASNSLAFLLTSVGAEIELQWPETLVGFVHIVNGIAGSQPRIRTSAGVLYILHHHNAALGQYLEVRRKPLSAPFARFEEYRDYLRSVVETAALNGCHPARRTRYRLLTTLSSGYDSPACAALACSAGCTEGVTVYQSRYGESDDGDEIGRHLGLRMKRVGHPLFADPFPDDPIAAAEFFSTGMQGEDITYVALEGLLNERLLVTGFHGDKVWNRYAEAGSMLARGDVSGSSLGEFRLRQNFVHLPLPFVGALQHPSIHAISNARAMHYWSLGGSYDRPIPRRIAEEAGVPRELFGHRKKAISTLVFSDIRLIPKEMRHGVETLIWAQPITALARYAVRATWFNVTLAVVGWGPYPSSSPPRAQPRWLLPAIRSACDRLWSAMLRRLMHYPFPIFEHTHPFGLFALAWSVSVVGERYRQSAVPTGSDAPSASGT